MYRRYYALRAGGVSARGVTFRVTKLPVQYIYRFIHHSHIIINSKYLKDDSNETGIMMKMPNWLNKTTFSPKKTPTRKASVSLASKDLSPKRIEKELGPNVGEIRICLGDQQAVFDGGLWVPETGKVGGTFKENEKLKKEVQKLREENNLLKIKFELLLDMVTQTTSEADIGRRLET